MNTDVADSRRARLLKKADEKAQIQDQKVIKNLRERGDFNPSLDYFLKLMEEGRTPAAVARRVQKPLVALLCVQAPLELLHALDLQPYKIFSGSYAAGQLSAQNLPALMCPMLRSVLGVLQMEGSADSFRAWVLPTTCDWVVKFPEMTALCDINAPTPLHWVELPHIKDNDRSQKRWLEEVYKLKDFLTRELGLKLQRRKLMASIEVYQKAWQAASRLRELRRAGKVPAVWAVLISNCFFLDTVENWTAALERVLPVFDQNSPRDGRVFLAGSPIYFPNYKMLKLMDEAGLNVVADDLCSSERIFPGGITYTDNSEFGLLAALAQRYHQGCLCPTFSDNERRVNNIINPSQQHLIEGVVFQVLKGCHPYDLESFTLELKLKDHGLKFIKLETDYNAEDSQNLLTRLEAYRHNL